LIINTTTNYKGIGLVKKKENEKIKSNLLRVFLSFVGSNNPNRMHKKEKHRKTFLIHPAFQLTSGGAWNHVPIVTMA
jgi:hypothetical protein